MAEEKAYLALQYSAIGNSFPSLRIHRITKREKGQLTSHPVESGGKIFDNRVRQPMTFSVTGALVGEDVGDDLKKLHEAAISRKIKGVGMFLVLHGLNIDTVRNLVITSMQYTESNEKFNAYDIIIEMSEVLLTTAKGMSGASDASDA